jgi:protein-L-isoaspartate O-methyltransferase
LTSEFGTDIRGCSKLSANIFPYSGEEKIILEDYRDLNQYEIDYRDLGFERIQEHFRKREALTVLVSRKTDSILEIGCGYDSIVSYVNFSHATILEPIRTHLKSAEKLMNKEAVERTTFIEGFAPQDIPLNKKFDVIYAMSIIHEISHPQAFLESLGSSLSEGGRIIITVTNKNSIHRLLGQHMGISSEVRTRTEDRMQQFTGAMDMDELENIIEISGFYSEHMGTFFPKLLPHETMSKFMSGGERDGIFLSKLFELGAFLPDFGSEIICVIRKRE